MAHSIDNCAKAIAPTSDAKCLILATGVSNNYFFIDYPVGKLQYYLTWWSTVAAHNHVTPKCPLLTNTSTLWPVVQLGACEEERRFSLSSLYETDSSIILLKSM